MLDTEYVGYTAWWIHGCCPGNGFSPGIHGWFLTLSCFSRPCFLTVCLYPQPALWFLTTMLAIPTAVYQMDSHYLSELEGALHICRARGLQAVCRSCGVKQRHPRNHPCMPFEGTFSISKTVGHSNPSLFIQSSFTFDLICNNHKFGFPMQYHFKK